MNAVLALEDGTWFRGTAAGAAGEARGEVVFNTSMTGYQEVLTDPSYAGQIVTMTSPQIGNYGVSEADVESSGPRVAGFIVRESSSEKHVAWGKVNRPIDAAAFDALKARMMAYLRGKELYVQDCWAGADPSYRLPIRIVTERAWHSLFARHMFIEEQSAAARAQHAPEFTVIDAPSFTARPSVDPTNSEVFILLNFAKKLVLIGGTNYAGEIKKSIFTVMNYILPLKDTMPMHCSANVGAKGDVALFFGLSGTGKTTLSSDPDRQLIGDDEHGWSTKGVFNFEGGCYAKMIRLSAEAEPQIYETTRRFGTVLENVTCDPATRALDLNDDAVTENTRGAYPLHFIDNALPGSQAGHPTNVVMLTADAFGVLPPIARLSPAGYEEVSRTHLIEPTHPNARRQDLGGVNWSHPAYANKAIFLRNDKEILKASLAKE